jgi:transposase
VTLNIYINMRQCSRTSRKIWLPAMEYIHKELTRKRVVLRLLRLEYRQANPDGYQYSQFCE